METYICDICGNTNREKTPCTKCNWVDYGNWQNNSKNVINKRYDTNGFGWICPVCENYNKGGIPEYDICALCGWEDDPLQRGDYNYSGGANWMSVNHAKANWKVYGKIQTEDEKKERIEFYKKHIAPDGTWIP
jgi:hypothetical protein